MQTYEYKIKINCAVCADKIEQKIRSLDYVESAALNFALGKLSVSTARGDIFDELKKIVASVEQDGELTRLNAEPEPKAPWYRDWFLWCFLSGALTGAAGLAVGRFVPAYNVLSIVLICVGAALMLIKTAIKAFKKTVFGRSIDENLLMSIAVVGAIAIGENLEGLLVIFLYQIGSFLEEKALAKSHRDIKNLLRKKPQTARLKTADGFIVVSPSQVEIGSEIVVFAGDVVPLDGEIVSGASSLDLSGLTGESVPVAVSAGDAVMSGSVNLDGVLTIKTTAKESESTITKIMRLIETAAERKAKTETLVSRAARIYTPVVISIAVLVFLLFAFVAKAGMRESVYRGMIFLVISCPCAIAISVPLSYFSGIGNASRKNILIKGSNYIDAMASLKTAVFDKTGTLTTGQFAVWEIRSESDLNQEEILRYAAAGEQNSAHPIARAIVAHYQKIFDGKELFDAKNISETAGSGLSFEADSKRVFVGRGQSQNGKTAVEVKIDGKTAGQIFLSDDIKPQAQETIEYLKSNGVDIHMFTGDNAAAANAAAQKIGIENVRAELLPQDKYEGIEKLLDCKRGTVAFVGDGINDSPVLTRADIGIAMGLSGSSATIDTADIVLMSDKLTKLPQLHKIARFTRRVVVQNLVLALSVKLLFMVLGTLGLAGMAWAVAADVGLMLISIFNSLRILRLK
jgi:Cd2+/Zn2+-exporting ATPase